MTAEKESGFQSEAVAKYINAQRQMPSPAAIVLPPPEFTAVVDTGKSAVPFLLKELNAADDVRREAALLALMRITNKSFVPYKAGRYAPGDWEKASTEYRAWWEANCP